MCFLKIEMETRRFNGKRLKEALQFRGKRMTELAESIGISKQLLSQYANGESNPPYDNIVKIAMGLKFPFEFFMTEDFCTTTTDKTYFRSQMSAKKLDQNAQKAKMEYVAKLYEVLLKYVDFPELNLPDVDFDESRNLFEADSEEVMSSIEIIASAVRQYWKIGNGPIDNMQYLLESNGIIVTGFKEVNNKIDAFSQRINIENHGTVFIVALALGEKSQARLNFDMAHELGHILLHKWELDEEEVSKDKFSVMEKQANMFASAFLLPREPFTRDVSLYARSIEAYRILKKKWCVSMLAMMYRARQLKIINANQFQYMMRTMAAKGNKLWEPGDVIGQLHSTIFQGAIDVLLNGDYITAKGLTDAFKEYGICLSQEDLEDIMALTPGTLDISKDVSKLVRLKFTSSNEEELK